MMLPDEHLKYVSLAVLVLQNCSLILVTRYSRTVPGPQYLASTAVLFAEVAKTCTALFIHGKHLHQAKQLSLSRLVDECFGEHSDFHKLLFPSVIYTIQNNLQYVAITYLDAATYQVTAQLKILTTAIFSVLFLGRSLSPRKWFSLVVLMIGVALVQWPADTDDIKKSNDDAGHKLLGFGAVVTACVLSGMAGVYTEKVLKTTRASLWLRNIQMGISGTLLSAIFGVMLADRSNIKAHGLFYGYDHNPAAWMAVSLNAFGGLLTAVVVKYADNILKGFATSIAIVLSCVLSVWFLDFTVTGLFMLGTAFVITATVIYGYPEPQGQRRPSPSVILPLASQDKGDKN